MSEAVEPSAIAAGQVMRHRWIWTGGTIGTGYTAFHAVGGAEQYFADQAYAFMSQVCGTGASSAIPNGIKVTPDGFVDILDAATGSLVTSVGITAPSVINGGSGGSYAAPGGVCINWSTGGVVGGKRVRGRTFIVPLNSSKYDTQGTLDDSYRTSAIAAAFAYRTGTHQPVVWHRPKAGAGGSVHVITGSGVRDRVSLLTSRR
jgi:hypothetical protein